MSATLAGWLLPCIVAVSLLLMLVRPRGVAEVYWISGGCLLLLLLGLVPLKLAGRAVMEGADVYLFLAGMMLMSALARTHGVFEWLSSLSVRLAKGSRTRLFSLVYGMGAVVTVCMSNDATAVVMTPAILAAVRRSRVAPLPYLFACAMIANAASFVLPISNPANLVVFHQGMPPLRQWLLSFGLPSLCSVAATYGMMRVVFRRDLRGSLDGDGEDVRLTREGRLVLGGLAVMVAVLLIASSFRRQLGLPAFLAALGIAALLCLSSRSNPFKLIQEVSWGTLVLVGGLFVMVDAVENVGLLQHTQRWLLWTVHLGASYGVFVAGFAVAVGNNLVNNLPLGLVAGGTLRAAHATGILQDAVLIGVDLGPNLSITGSLATILWLLALRKEKLDVSFFQFLKVGIVVMPVALLCSLGGALLVAKLWGGL